MLGALIKIILDVNFDEWRVYSRCPSFVSCSISASSIIPYSMQKFSGFFLSVHQYQSPVNVKFAWFYETVLSEEAQLSANTMSMNSALFYWKEHLPIEV